jgi:hypothetical protein
MSFRLFGFLHLERPESGEVARCRFGDVLVRDLVTVLVIVSELIPHILAVHLPCVFTSSTGGQMT